VKKIKDRRSKEKNPWIILRRSIGLNYPRTTFSTWMSPCPRRRTSWWSESKVSLSSERFFILFNFWTGILEWVWNGGTNDKSIWESWSHGGIDKVKCRRAGKVKGRILVVRLFIGTQKEVSGPPLWPSRITLGRLRSSQCNLSIKSTKPLCNINLTQARSSLTDVPVPKKKVEDPFPGVFVMARFLVGGETRR